MSASHPAANTAAATPPAVETRMLDATDVVRCLPPDACREAVQRAFVKLATGRTGAPRSLGFDAGAGTFHLKAALYAGEIPLLVAKLNGNFPGNPASRGLPTIQGVLLVADARDGRPIALMDTGMVTALRTAATSAVAARHLARRDASVAAIIGCGMQGRVHVEALRALRPIEQFRLFDRDPERLARLAEWCGAHAGGTVVRAASAADAAGSADIVATCTTGGAFVLGPHDVRAGTFVAAVGADHPHKREIDPALMARARVVVDDLDQCAASGDLHHAFAAGAMTTTDVHAELGRVVAGLAPGRASDDEIVIFDSTGIAIEDAAAAEVICERALAAGIGTITRFTA